MKTNHVTFAILLAIAVGNLSAGVSAAENKSSVNSADEKFVKQAGAAGMAEVKIATLGTQKAERVDVKDLATMLVTDHTKANAELTTLAESKKVELSAVIDPKAASVFKDLEKESGKSFDKAFLDHLQSAHKDSISLFEDAEKNATDGDVKAFAGKTLPVLRGHLDKIKELAAK
jgi:putative membrane protein